MVSHHFGVEDLLNAMEFTFLGFNLYMACRCASCNTFLCTHPLRLPIISQSAHAPLLTAPSKPRPPPLVLSLSHGRGFWRCLSTRTISSANRCRRLSWSGWWIGFLALPGTLCPRYVLHTRRSNRPFCLPYKFTFPLNNCIPFMLHKSVFFLSSSANPTII